MRIALMFGGKSPEHEVSLRSARNIYAAIPRDKYEVLLIGVGRSGKWYWAEEQDLLTEGKEIDTCTRQLAVIPGLTQAQIIELSNFSPIPEISAVFSIIHGPNGEDGTMQGLLSQLELPFVGPSVLGSSVAMDKDMCKRLFRQAGLRVAEDIIVRNYEKDAIDYHYVINKLGSPVFVKPANMGSSVGVSKVTNEEEFKKAIALAFEFDTKVLIEEMIVGRELECAVLGNEFPEAGSVGEISMEKGFYDYESKYVSDAAKISIPAENLSEDMIAHIRLIAQQAYKALELEGLTRVDVFLTQDEDVYINEVNTLPGFTSISMYPKLWEAVGLSYSDLIDKLIQLAIARQERSKALKRVR